MLEKQTIFIDAFRSPLGQIWIASDLKSVIRLQLPCARGKERLTNELLRQFGPKGITLKKGGSVNTQLLLELQGYFSGNVTIFRTPALPQGTPFQKKAWQQVSRIPYGKTCSYGKIASRLGIPKGARAIGQANRNNPIPLLIPCHRVIAGDGGLGGFSAGIAQKRWLLQWENLPQKGRN